MSFFRVADLESVAAMPGIRRRAVWMDHVMVTFFEFEPRAVVPEHAHPNEQITVVTKGALDFTLGTERRVLGPGEGVRIPAGVPHGACVLDEPSEAWDAWSPPRADYKV
jgi:quercetin dioxygenase-like cupin family protein